MFDTPKFDYLLEDNPQEVMQPDPLPAKTEEFLCWLDAYWPHKCPEGGLSLEAIHRYAGARSLIDMLMSREIEPG